MPPYCDREGGFVCNIAIARYSTVTLAPGEGSKEPLVGAAMQRYGTSGFGARIQNDFPLGAGLGGSSAASAAILGALRRLKGEALDLVEIAEEGRRIEVENLGIAGGRQDHYAATHGGALALTFDTGVQVRRIELSKATADELVRRALLVYTGESRISGDTITAVLGAYESRDQRVLNALGRMKQLARDMATSLEQDDLDATGALMGEHWAHQRSLHPSIPTARIDEIVRLAAGAGALGSKAMGASGGGCVLIIGRSETTPAIRRAVETLGTVLDFTLDQRGLDIVSAA